MSGGKTILEPLGDRILLKQTDAKDVSEGGIILPKQSQDPPKEGEVIAVGPGKRLESGETIPVQVCPGDQVIFANYAGQEIEIDKEPFLLLGADDILAKVRRE